MRWTFSLREQFRIDFDRCEDTFLKFWLESKGLVVKSHTRESLLGMCVERAFDNFIRMAYTDYTFDEEGDADDGEMEELIIDDDDF